MEPQLKEEQEEVKESEIDKVLNLFPISQDRANKIIELSRTNDFRALLINNLIVTVDRTFATELEAVKNLSEAKAIVRMLKMTLKNETLNKK